MNISDVLKIATRHSQAGQIAEAEAILRQALHDHPEHPEALHLMGLVAHQAGRTAEGIDFIERALRAVPNVIGFQANLAEMYRRSGNTQKAIDLGRVAIALKRDHADAHFNLGLALFDAGDYASAVARFDEAARLRPPFAEAINSRGIALYKLGRLAHAEADYRRAISVRPSYPEALNNLGTVLRDLARPADAVAVYRKALALRPHYLAAPNNLILAHKDLRQFDEAIAAANQALRFSPRNAETLARLAAVHVDQRNPDAAIGVLDILFAAGGATAEVYDLLGRVYFQTRNVEKAVAAYRKAIEMDPALARTYVNLGNAMNELGRFDEAIQAFETALKMNPQLVDTYLDLANAKTFRSSDDCHLKAIEVLVAQTDTLAMGARMPLHFAAAKAYDDIGRYEEAFAQLVKGNALKRRTVDYDEPALLAFFERVKETVSPELLRAKAGGGCESAQPIFIIGMPRSGTTLVEQILAGHPSVKTAGEPDDLARALDAATDGEGKNIAYPESLPMMPRDAFGAIGADYVRRLDRYAPGAERILDKATGNFLFTGLIHLALPNARIVHVKRGALDTCLSCFSKLFAGGWHQTYDLRELGRYYRAYDDLMKHWCGVLPAGAILDVQYEAVVGDIESEARRILDYCGIPWSARVLEFYKHDRPIKSASVGQARQPIYRSSVARWRNYARFLEPLISELGGLE